MFVNELSFLSELFFYSSDAVCVFVVDSDGSLDFGTIKVSEEAKRSIKLENKGKYDIGFK